MLFYKLLIATIVVGVFLLCNWINYTSFAFKRIDLDTNTSIVHTKEYIGVIDEDSDDSKEEG